MPNELVSVVIPAYNSADTIRNSIISATAQSYENIEIIVVNDGSTDNTADICKRCAEEDRRIKYFSQRNSGVSVARNFGINMANGEFIAFLDADDLWEQDKIEWQVTASRKKPEAVILTQLQRFSGDGNSKTLLSKPLLPPSYKTREDYLLSLLNLGNHEMPSFATSLVRKDHLEVSGIFDENLDTAEDWDLWLRLALHFPFVNIDQPLLLYRKHAGSLTRKTILGKTLQNQLYVVDKITHHSGLSPSKICAVKMRKYLEFASIYRYQKMRFHAIKMVLKAISSSPAAFIRLFLEKIHAKTGRLMKMDHG